MAVFYCALVCVLMVGVESLSSGPPVKDHPGICDSMNPSHGVSASTNNPYEVVVNQDCYKETDTVQVRIRTKEDRDKKKIKGFFMQGREEGTTVRTGTFKANDNDHIKPLTCTNENDAIGHSGVLDDDEVVVQWTPDSGNTKSVHFRVTVVHKKEEFWLGVTSESLPYNATCVSHAVRSHSSLGWTLLIVLAMTAASLIM